MAQAEFDTVDAFQGETPYLQGMMIALDPHTGAVRAMIGGRNFEQSKFDRVRLARRQAGSAFKPFVYASAIASGIPASHIVVDQPVVYPQLTGDDWRPRNFTEEFSGPITLREALRRSINMVAIKLGVDSYREGRVMAFDPKTRQVVYPPKREVYLPEEA